MAFPTGQTVSTSNLDSATDSPANARADLLLAVGYLNDIIASENTALGVCVLNGSGEIDSTQMPSTISTSSLTLNPTDKVVNIQNVLRLTALPSTDIAAISSPQIGDIVISDDADSGNAAVCFYDGTDWRYMGFGNLTAI